MLADITEALSKFINTGLLYADARDSYLVRLDVVGFNDLIGGTINVYIQKPSALSYFRNDELIFCDIISSAKQLFNLCVAFIREMIFDLIQANCYGQRDIELLLQKLLNVIP